MVATRRVGIAAAALTAACGLAGCYLPLSAAAAGGLLHPSRRHVTVTAPQGCAESRIQGDGLTLAG